MVKAKLDFEAVYNLEDLSGNWLYRSTRFLADAIANDETLSQMPIEVKLRDDIWFGRYPPELRGLPGPPWHPHWAVDISRLGDSEGPELYWSYGWEDQHGDPAIQPWDYETPADPPWPPGIMPTFEMIKEAKAKLVYYGDYHWGDIPAAWGTRLFVPAEESNFLEVVLDFAIPHLRTVLADEIANCQCT